MFSVFLSRNFANENICALFLCLSLSLPYTFSLEMSFIEKDHRFLDNLFAMTAKPHFNFDAVQHCHFHSAGGRSTFVNAPRCTMKVVTDKDQKGYTGTDATVVGLGHIIHFVNPYVACENAWASSRRKAFGQRHGQTIGGTLATKRVGYESDPIFTLNAADGKNYIVLSITEVFGVTLDLVMHLHSISLRMKKAWNAGTCSRDLQCVSVPSCFQLYLHTLNI